MKSNKAKNLNQNDELTEDQEIELLLGIKKVKVKKGYDDHRRPIKNWTKAYTEHLDDLDELDDFYAKV